MSQSLERIPVPIKRPPGVTAKQWRLAALLPRAESAYQAMIQAGYSPATARSDARITRERTGISRATEALEYAKRDKARGLKAFSDACLETATVDVRELDIRDRLALGLQAAKIANEIGEEPPDVSASVAEALRVRRRRFVLTWALAWRAGLEAARTGDMSTMFPPVGRKAREGSPRTIDVAAIRNNSSDNLSSVNSDCGDDAVSSET